MPSVPSRRPLKPANILLVDDNRDGVAARQSFLKELGYIVVCAHSGLDALKAAAEQNFDLIITDFKMAPINGVELIAKMREQNFRTPIILLTGFADSLGLCPETTGANVVIQKNANEVANLIRQTKRLLQPARKPARSERAGGNASKAAE